MGRVWYCLFALIVVLFVLSLARSRVFAGNNAIADAASINPGTPEATSTIETLNHAATFDRLNAKGYKGGERQKTATFYYHKADEAEGLARKLAGGESVSANDVRKALDTSDAVRYNGGQF